MVRQIGFTPKEFAQKIIENEGGLEKVILRNVQTNKVSEHEIDGLFLGIGHKPISDIFKIISYHHQCWNQKQYQQRYYH